jgi:hypothetical protein
METTASLAEQLRHLDNTQRVNGDIAYLVIRAAAALDSKDEALRAIVESHEDNATSLIRAVAREALAIGKEGT